MSTTGFIVSKETGSQSVRLTLKRHYFPLITFRTQKRETKRGLYNHFSDICMDGDSVSAFFYDNLRAGLEMSFMRCYGKSSLYSLQSQKKILFHLHFSEKI